MSKDDSTKLLEERPLKRLSEEISKHFRCGATNNGQSLARDPILDEEMTDVDVSRLLPG